MALQSQFFRGVPELEAAAVSDPAHILQGSNGDHVGLIQQALIALDAAQILRPELASKRYGPSTACGTPLQTETSHHQPQLSATRGQHRRQDDHGGVGQGNGPTGADHQHR